MQNSQKHPNNQVQNVKSLSDANKLSLWLDDYNDIFSDFDPRHHSKRTLSDDFISEAKKLTRDTSSGKIELYLQLPAPLRNFQLEKIIKKRLRDYFKKRCNYFLEYRRKILRQGAFFISLGIFLMMITTFILVNYHGQNFFITLLSVIAEPAGWFLFWEGLNLVIFGSKKRKNDLEFNRKMSVCNIYFHSSAA